LVDRFTNEERWSDTLPRTHNLMAYWYNGYQNLQFPCHYRGHLIFLNIGPMVYAFDPVDHRKLWDTSLLGAAISQQQPITPDRDNGLLIHYPDGVTHRLGQAGPFETTYVCIQSRDGISALDPLKGTVLWTKTDVPVSSQVFGDEDHLYVVEMRPDGTPSGCRALRAADGVAVDVPDFAALYQRRQRLVGRNLLLWETAADGGMVLRLYDVHTGKDLVNRKFSRGAMLMHSQDPALAGVVEPSAGGKVTAVDLTTNQDVLVTRVEPADVDKAQEIHLLQDAQQFYVAVHRPADVQANPWGNSYWANVSNGMRWLMVNGKVYAFERKTGKMRWWAQVPNQMLVLDQFQDMPMLLFTAQYNKGINPGGVGMRQASQHFAAVKSIDRRTGKLIFDSEYPQPHQQFYALQANLQAGTIDLASYNLRIQHYLETDAQAKAGGAFPSSPDPVPEVADSPFRRSRAVPPRRVP
jgi:outer membrane protein assembly factor BamB